MMCFKLCTVVNYAHAPVYCCSSYSTKVSWQFSSSSEVLHLCWLNVLSVVFNGCHGYKHLPLDPLKSGGVWQRVVEFFY